MNGAPVVLSSLEFDLLAALARAPGRVFSRAQLLERVWGYDFYGDERVVDVHIRSLRARLGDDAGDPRLDRHRARRGLQVRRSGRDEDATAAAAVRLIRCWWPPSAPWWPT